MDQVSACLRSYVAAWWMKLIAAAITLVAVCLVVFVEPATVWEPAWPHPHLASWRDVTADQSTVEPGDVEGLTIDPRSFDAPMPEERIRSVIRSLSRLRGCRVELPPDLGDGLQAKAQAAMITALFEELGRLPELESLELAGLTPAAVDSLAELRGSPGIRRLITSLLYANDAATAAEWFASLVDSVVSFPSLEEWGLPRDAAARLGELDAERIAALRNHPSLRTLRVPPDRMALGQHVRLWCRKVLPGMKTPTSFVDRSRLSAAWGVLAATMFAAGLVVISAAGMLVLSVATVVPRYAESHRAAVFALLVVIAMASTVVLVRLNVAVVPAVIWAAVSALVPAAVLEWDRRRPVAGILTLPMTFSWMVGIFVPRVISERGAWWVWLDQFFESNLPTTTTCWMLLAMIAAAVVSWRAFSRYAVSLAERDRVAVVSPTPGQWWQARGRDGGPRAAGQMQWPSVASRAVRLDRLSSCDTPGGCCRLLAEGMVTVPRRHLLKQGTIFLVLAPLLMSVTVPAFRADPQLLVISLGAIVVVGLWFRPVLGWNDRAPRIAGEIGCLLPRQLYVAAMRGLLVRRMQLPSLVMFTALGGMVVWRTGQWWPLMPLGGLTLGAAVVTVSIIELMLTIHSSLLAVVAVALGIAYPAFAAAAMAVVVLLNVNNPSWQPEAWARLAPFLIVAVMAVGLRLWLNRRMQRFEFGRLV